MKVYVLESGVYEERCVAGVYATAEAAMRAHPHPGWIEEPDGSWNTGGVGDDYDSMGLTEYDVQTDGP